MIFQTNRIFLHPKCIDVKENKGTESCLENYYLENGEQLGFNLFQVET